MALRGGLAHGRRLRRRPDLRHHGDAHARPDGDAHSDSDTTSHTPAHSDPDSDTYPASHTPAHTATDAGSYADAHTRPDGPELRFEVTGTSCGGTVRWSAGTSGNGNGTTEAYPWSLTRIARSGDRVTLRACSSECGSEHEVTVTVTVFWRGSPIATRSRTDDTRAGHCEPSSSVEGNLP